MAPTAFLLQIPGLGAGERGARVAGRPAIGVGDHLDVALLGGGVVLGGLYVVDLGLDAELLQIGLKVPPRLGSAAFGAAVGAGGAAGVQAASKPSPATLPLAVRN